jgi:hypothetical protein
MKPRLRLGSSSIHWLCTKSRVYSFIPCVVPKEAIHLTKTKLTIYTLTRVNWR